MAQCQRGRYGAANSLAYDASASKRRTLNAGSPQRPRHSEAATPLALSIVCVFSVRIHLRISGDARRSGSIPRRVRLYEIIESVPAVYENATFARPSLLTVAHTHRTLSQLLSYTRAVEPYWSSGTDHAAAERPGTRGGRKGRGGQRREERHNAAVAAAPRRERRAVRASASLPGRGRQRGEGGEGGEARARARESSPASPPPVAGAHLYFDFATE